MSSNELFMTFSAISENEAFARNAAALFMLKLDPTIEEVDDIKTAVSEAVTNCIVHAYRDSEGDISMKIITQGNQVEIAVTDFGVGIPDVEAARSPFFSTKSDDGRSGLGFTVMESTMDKVEVISCGGGVTVKMTKEIHK